MTYSQGRRRSKEIAPQGRIIRYYKASIIITLTKRKNSIMGEKRKFRREMEVIKKNQKKILETKYLKFKSSLYWLI